MPSDSSLVVTSPPATKSVSPSKLEEKKKDTPAVVIEYDIAKFRLERILNNNTRMKSIVMLGTFPECSGTEKAIVIFEKSPFRERDMTITETVLESPEKSKSSPLPSTEEELNSTKSITYFSEELKVHREFVNNIYGNYRCTPPPNLSGKFGPFYGLTHLDYASMFIIPHFSFRFQCNSHLSCHRETH